MKTCAVCGKQFEETFGKQIICSPDCKRERKNKQQKEYVRIRAENKRVVKSKTDWQAITRLCDEKHMTYGQLVAHGII